MSRFAAPITALTLALALGTAGCGEAKVEQGPSSTSSDKTNEYLPLATGNTWQFRVTDNDGVMTDKTTVVGERELVGGTGPHAGDEAFHVVTTKDGSSNNADKTESWQDTVVIDGDPNKLATVRYREIAYQKTTGMPELEEHWKPYKLRVDNYRVAGDTWDETYQESKIPIPADPMNPPKLNDGRYDTWVVQSDAISVTVPAGTFMAKMVMRRATDPQDPDKVYWFVSGIGKVKETGSQEEQLEDCTIGEKTCAELAAAQ